MADRPRYLLFLHGIRSDDPSQEWLEATNASLRRLGERELAERGYKLLSPSYLSDLEKDDVRDVVEPGMTYKKGSDDDYRRSAGQYWRAVASLERSGIRGEVREPRFRSAVPASGAAAQVMPRRFKDADRYCRELPRRNVVLAKIIAEVPPRSDLVVVAHSLGSVVAADLLYFLPEDCHVELLMTLGSPLALPPVQEHLARHRNRFPFERVGMWINLVGTGDVVTGYRGLSTHFPEVVDVFVDTSEPGSPHASTSYLDSDVPARAILWAERESADLQSPPGEALVELPDTTTLPLLVGAQYALRLEQSMPPSEQRVRFSEARKISTQDLIERLVELGETRGKAGLLLNDNDELLRNRSYLDAEAVALLVSARLGNAVQPFEVRPDRDARLQGLEKLANDLNKGSSWARTVVENEKDARSAHKDGWSAKRTFMAIAGVAAVIAAPALVLAAAPAALSGGAAVVAGLAALGPGGMLGGIGIVSLIGGAGGAVAARALISGSPEAVRETVVYMQTLAKSANDLGAPEAARQVWAALVAMEDTARDDFSRLAMFNDKRAQGSQDAEKKAESVNRALTWLERHGLNPAQLEPGEGEDV